jgi:hypothetical protein
VTAIVPRAGSNASVQGGRGGDRSAIRDRSKFTGNHGGVSIMAERIADGMSGALFLVGQMEEETKSWARYLGSGFLTHRNALAF